MRGIDVAVVGGGPAGAYCALELARKGIRATILDYSHPREKPCGGGITPTLMRKFPSIEKIVLEDGISTDLKIISCTNREIVLKGVKGFNISRLCFDKAILDMATKGGAKLTKEKVIDIREKHASWEIVTNKQLLTARILIGADGVNSLVRRKVIGAIPKEDLMLAFGYVAGGVEKECSTVKYLSAIPGYIWIFPRRSNSSIGIGSELKYGYALKKLLDEYLQSHFPNIKIISRFAAMLPSAKSPDFFDLPCAGRNWILVGDAAGHADPITGEGILYALWSGKLAAEAILHNDLRLYDSIWREQYGDRLKERAKRRDFFFDPLTIELSIMLNSIYRKY